MATTNLIPWNPTAVNQETDAQYLADSQRAGGATNPSEFAAVLANKAFYQWSTYLTALFTAFANKGFTTSDSSLSTLTAQCANFLTTADILPAIVSVPYTATPTFPAGTADGFQMTLTGNVTSSTITGVRPGQPLSFCFVQDGTGGRTVAWPAGFVGALQPDPAPTAVSFILFQADLSGTVRAVGPVVSNNGVYVAPLTAASFTLSTGAPAGAVLTGTGAVFAARSLVPNDVTGTRAYTTVYQNTSGADMVVRVSSYTPNSAGGTVLGYIGATNPPTMYLGKTSAVWDGNPSWCQFSFDVPTGWYYALNSANSTLLERWIEWTWV